MANNKLALLQHQSQSPITKRQIQLAINHLEYLDIDVVKVELLDVESMTSDMTWIESSGILNIYTTTNIDSETATKLWDSDILDVYGSLTFFDGFGKLMWRES
jgi:uncharacterized protein YgbK (DUF1537 family)